MTNNIKIIKQQTSSTKINNNQAGGKSYVLASAVHKHPKFDPNVSPDNDIAILKVTTTEKYNLISSLAGQGSHHMLVLTKLKLYKHSLHILNINPLSSPRISPSLTRSNQLASPLALQKTTAVSSKRALTDFISRKISFIMMDICF